MQAFFNGFQVKKRICVVPGLPCNLTFNGKQIKTIQTKDAADCLKQGCTP